MSTKRPRLPALAALLGLSLTLGAGAVARPGQARSPAGLPAGAQSRYADLPGVRLHYVVMGSGPAVVLLHGWPESWYAWRKVMPILARRHTVIAPDMRGFGDSSRPPTGYDKLTVAADIHALTRRLGLARIDLVVQDMGGPVGYAYAASYPDQVRRFVFIESSVPGFGFEQAMDVAHGGSWHIGFNMARGIAETLVAGKERQFLDYFYDRGTAHAQALTRADRDEYLRSYRAGAMHAGFEYYRTLFDDAKANAVLARTKLTMPVLAIGAAQAGGDGPRRSIGQVASDVTGVVIPDAKHFVAQDQPDAVAAAISTFIDEGPAG